jgi:hypothetical protein
MLIDEIEAVAQAIYATHRRRSAPDWDSASEDVKNWVRAQAMSAINQLRARGWRERGIRKGWGKAVG